MIALFHGCQFRKKCLLRGGFDFWVSPVFQIFPQFGQHLLSFLLLLFLESVDLLNIFLVPSLPILIVLHLFLLVLGLFDVVVLLVD